MWNLPSVLLVSDAENGRKFDTSVKLKTKPIVRNIDTLLTIYFSFLCYRFEEQMEIILSLS